VYLFLGGGLLLFFLGTFAWLSARAHKKDVADFWVYRISRHPQYLGWILWSYGVFLLLMRGYYPKRSWGIDASLPWLLSTVIIIGVAMLEELQMRRRYGESYEAYRQKAPLLFPVPAFVSKIFAYPLRLMYGKEYPERRREVAVVLSLYAVLLISASALFYGGALNKALEFVTPIEERNARMEELATQIREHPNRRTRYFVSLNLAAYGEPAVDQFILLLQDDQSDVRALSAESLGKIRAPSAVPALIQALGDSVANVRVHAILSLATIGSPEVVEPMMGLLEDPDNSVRRTAMGSLAELRAEEVIDRLIEMLEDPDAWVRIETIEALGTLGMEEGLPPIIQRLSDEKPRVRRAAVVALTKIGSPRALEALKHAMEDADWEVRLYAAEGVKHLESVVK
jgi:hypothetical protein